MDDRSQGQAEADEKKGDDTEDKNWELRMFGYLIFIGIVIVVFVSR